MEEYELEGFKLLDHIGEGTYGDVFKAESLTDGKIYAIKFIRFRESSLSNGVSVSTIREIRFLKSTEHKNIVKLFDIVSPNVSINMRYSELKPICMIMDYVDHDMWGLLQLAKDLKLPIYTAIHVKWYMFQILNALAYLHSNMIIHRDLKTSNILVTNNHIIKLTDFGLARKLKYGDGQHYTNNVMTLWYRPPELLLGETNYKTETDIWSAGCIFGELLTGSPIFPTHADDEREELHVIFKACGMPESEYITGLLQEKRLEFKNYPPNLQNYLQDRARVVGITKPESISDDVMNLLLQMLQVDPKHRKTAVELLQHPYFDEVRAHAPDLPPFSENLNTHRFQVKSRVKKGNSVTRTKSGEKSEIPFFDTSFVRAKNNPEFGIFLLPNLKLGGNSEVVPEKKEREKLKETREKKEPSRRDPNYEGKNRGNNENKVPNKDGNRDGEGNKGPTKEGNRDRENNKEPNRDLNRDRQKDSRRDGNRDRDGNKDHNRDRDGKGSNRDKEKDGNRDKDRPKGSIDSNKERGSNDKKDSSRSDRRDRSRDRRDRRRYEDERRYSRSERHRSRSRSHHRDREHRRGHSSSRRH